MPMDADPFQLQKQFGTQLQRLSLVQFFDRIKQIDEAAVRDDVDKVQSLGLGMNGVTKEDLALNSRYYLAMTAIMAEENLDAMSIQCWPEFAADLGQWPYLAITRMSDENKIVALEGDVEGALTAFAGQLAGAGLGYLTDWLEHDDKTIHFWHAGMAPIGWLEKSKTAAPSLGKHFNIAKPMVVDGPIKPNLPMTAARIWHCDGQYRAAAFEGKSVANPRQMTGNTMLFEPTSDGSRATRDVRDRFDALLHAGLPHHVVLFQGHHEKTLRRLARMTDCAWID
jgi:L-fucose isomerase-like protein